MEPRRCGTHGLVLGADGRCIICRRGDPDQPAAKTSSDWPIVLGLVFLGVLFVGSGAYWLTRKIASLSASPEVAAPPTAQTADPPVVVKKPETYVPPSDPFATQQPIGETPLPITTTKSPAEEAAELDQRKKRVKVTMFMRKPCSLCDQARGFLASREYSLKEVDVDASETDKVLLESVNSAGTVPTFDVEGKILVGYDPNVLESTITKAAKSRDKR